MKKQEIIERSQKFVAPYCVTDGKKFRLKDIDPNDTGQVTPEDKPRAKELLESGVEVLAELQDVLYAQDQWSILLIFQAMDAAGKDGAIKHVMSGINPQGCQVDGSAFLTAAITKRPSLSASILSY
jgi:polyphosphate kinase 2 (PPK2 family)